MALSGLGRKPNKLFRRVPSPVARTTATLVVTLIYFNPFYQILDRCRRCGIDV